MTIPEAVQLVLQASTMGKGLKFSFWKWVSRSELRTLLEA